MKGRGTVSLEKYLVIPQKGKHRITICCCSVVQSCLTLCDPMDCSTPGFPGGSVVKTLPANVGDMGSIPGAWKIPHAAGN